MYSNGATQDCLNRKKKHLLQLSMSAAGFSLICLHLRSKPFDNTMQSWPSKTIANNVFCLRDYSVFTEKIFSAFGAKTIEKAMDELRKPNLSRKTTVREWIKMPWCAKHADKS